MGNAHAEATNKTVKTRYLNLKDIDNTEHLITTMEHTVIDINTLRPHGRIGGLIPLACYTGKKVDSIVLSSQLAAARKERTTLNRNNSCNSCYYLK